MIKISNSTILLIILILIFSIFIANISIIIGFDEKLIVPLSENADEDNRLASKITLHMNDNNEHLMWFVQISDIHISLFQDKKRIEELKYFLTNDLDIINPSVVLASGDLTDARSPNRLGSRQYKEEWEIYKNILSSSNIANKTIWLDIRGNHDYFNVPGINSSLNYFNYYSIQGTKYQRSYLKQLVVGEEKYSFIAIDACMEPGPKRQFNFIGVLTVSEISRIIELNEEARKLGGNYTIWFSHYPTSCIMSIGAGIGGIREILGNYEEGYAYLCGHLHTQGGLIPEMYTLQHAGFLELELGDWKDNRLYRIAAFDHGLFSFIDVHFNDWPVILITNPKNAIFNMPHKEDINLQLKSEFIRMLIFSNSSINICKIKIDSELWKTCYPIDNNLFVTKWSPNMYLNGLHKITVSVETKNGKKKTITQDFSLDGSHINFHILARLVLMMDVNKILQIFFGLSVAICVIPLCIFRLIHKLIQCEKIKKPRIKSIFLKFLIRKLWILSTVNQLFIPIILCCMYIAFGPWSFGEIIDQHYGIVFSWGIFMKNSYLPGTITYIYGFLQLMFCELPLIFIFANAAENRFNEIYEGVEKNSKVVKYFKHIPFGCILIGEIILAIYFCIAYGILAFFFAPMRTWSVIKNIILYYCALNLKEKDLKSAAVIWKT